jgi:adenylate cyclase class IV
MDDKYELEYKYSASDISLKKFMEFCESKTPITKIEVGSWDSYYSDGKDFIRLREGPHPELTIKRKIVDTNNFSRIEVDLPLDPDIDNRPIVSTWVGLLGYKENFRVYKNCIIYFYDNWNIVYYIVYDQDLKEKGRFLEIEINKKKVSELGGSEGALVKLKIIEESLSELDITPSNRLRKSLWEMFKKTD